MIGGLAPATTFKQRIELIRSQLGVNVKEFAKLAKISRQTLYAAFKREQQGEPLNLDTETARLIAKVANCSVGWVRDGVESESPPGVPSLPLPPDLRLARKQAIKVLINEDLDPDDVFDAVGRALAGITHRPGQLVPSAAAITAIARQFLLATNPEPPPGPKRGRRRPSRQTKPPDHRAPSQQ